MSEDRDRWPRAFWIGLTVLVLVGIGVGGAWSHRRWKSHEAFQERVERVRRAVTSVRGSMGAILVPVLEEELAANPGFEAFRRRFPPDEVVGPGGWFDHAGSGGRRTAGAWWSSGGEATWTLFYQSPSLEADLSAFSGSGDYPHDRPVARVVVACRRTTGGARVTVGPAGSSLPHDDLLVETISRELEDRGIPHEVVEPGG